MPVTRWNAELLELLDWVNREDLSLDDLFLGAVGSKNIGEECDDQ